MRSILSRYLIREALVSLVFISLVLVLIYFSGYLANLLGKAASGRFPSDLIGQLLLIETSIKVILLLPPSFFLALLLTFGRMYQDNEMSVLAACGVSQWGLYRTLLPLIFPFVIIMGFLAFTAMPSLIMKVKLLEQHAEHRADIAGINAGRFKESKSGGVIFYTESISDDRSELKGVFVQNRGDESTGWISAARGRQYVDEKSGQQYLLLKDGYRYEGQPGRRDFRITRFEEYGVRISSEQKALRYERAIGQPTALLLNSDRLDYQAEFHWRLSIPIMVLMFSVLALLLSHTKPRQGRFSKLVLAIVVYLVYSNLIIMGKTWLEDGAVPMAVGLWWAHGLMLIFVGLLIAKRMEWRHILARKPQPSGGHASA